MKQALDLSTTPCDETCSQMGDDNYHQQSRKECRVFVKQLWRTIEARFGSRDDYPDSFGIVVKSNPHDFGSYLSVEAKFDTDNERSVELAFWLEENIPSEWDEEAKKELDMTIKDDFETWMKAVDAIVCTKLGLSVHDLSDMPFRDSFDDGISPEDFVQDYVRSNIEEEYGEEYASDMLDD